MNRIDIAKTIELIDFGTETWEWIDLWGTIVAETQREAMIQEKKHIADTPYKKYVLCVVNKDLQTLAAIYLLLRCEIIHQAASHVRLLCESLITTKYVSKDPGPRSDQFWGYLDIESYQITESLLEWESTTANPAYVEKLERFKESIKESYERRKPEYSYMPKKGNRQRTFSNWCNKSVYSQAKEGGPELERLYQLVYRQMSSYIHGTAWSLRRQISYCRDHHDPKIVLNDVAAIIRTASAVWVEWAKFCCTDLGWGIEDLVLWVHDKNNELDNNYFVMT